MRNVDGNSNGGGQGSVTVVTNGVVDITAAKSNPAEDCNNNDNNTKSFDHQESLQQLWKWNEHVPLQIRQCMHDLISHQVRQRPETLAVQSWDGSLTYQQVENFSNTLAKNLLQVGIDSSKVVPLCFEKSVWAVVALLGVMKTGAAFSLTDPSQPEARLRTIIEQTEANVLVTSTLQSGLGEKIIGNGQVIAISQQYFDDDDDHKLATSSSSSSSSSLPQVSPASPMYVIFTSGSTGKPKGVVISHENYTSGAIPRAEAVGYNSNSRVFDFPSYAFDVSIDCMLCTLACGGQICVPSEERRMNDLSGAIRDSKANMVHMTPSVARVLDADIIPSLEVLGLGGEAVSARDAACWSQHTSLIIAYGPSECTVGCTINNTVTVSTGIGKGVGGTTWIVDPDNHNTLVPVGAVGELLIEGPVVGIGYLGEPAKTAEVFIEDPTWLLAGYGTTPGRSGRLYKTGDLVRYEDNMSGSIEFVGRKDQQIKLRGQRVELAEVEHHVRSCVPSSVKVAAEVIKPENGTPTLLAFLSEHPSSTADSVLVEPSADLQSALANIDSAMGSKVPRYMIPAAFLTLSHIPSLVSGKTDRKKLREIGLSIPRSQLSRQIEDTPEQEPDTESEKKLQAAWIKVLGVEAKIYKQSNFFAIGGDSLRAMRLVAAAREQGLSLTVANIFTTPTLDAMAAGSVPVESSETDSVLPFSLLPLDWDTISAKKEVSSHCNVTAEEIEDIYPCTPLQEALMALSAKVKEAYIAQRVVDLPDADTAERLINAFDVAQENSPILRTRIVQVPGRGLMQVIVQGKLKATRGIDCQSYLVSDREQDMDLGQPLIRYGVINEPSGRVCFVLTMHHALYDGWSMPLIVERVNEAYLNKTISRPAEFKHFIKYLSSIKREDSASYWKSQLDGTNPLQFPQLPFQGYQTQADSLLEEYVQLDQLPSSNATIATVIRAAWAIVASQYIHGSTDVVFGETLTGRNAPLIGAEEIEGPMITTVPMRLQVDNEMSTATFLASIQEQTITQIQHEHFGLQHIRRLSPDALEACELRTGIVLHPSTDAADSISENDLPANRLVPAGDAEAAQEALKFNTYALMLVCSIDPKGFLVMASFDSNTVDKGVMENILKKFSLVARKICERASASLGDIAALIQDDDTTSSIILHDTINNTSIQSVKTEFPTADAAYIVDTQQLDRFVPIGAAGDLVISSAVELELEEVSIPVWLSSLIPCAKLYKTGKLGRYLGSNINILAAPVHHNPSQLQPKKKISASSRKQRQLRLLWSKVLHISEEDISVDDSFFALGGDSIAAMKLASEARAEGLRLGVAQMFAHRELFAMAAIATEISPSETTKVSAAFSLLTGLDTTKFQQEVKTMIQDENWVISNILPTRPLQHIAVKATATLPRFSTRYEMLFFDSAIDKDRLKAACQALVSQVEVLHTVFVEHESNGYAVVVDNLIASFEEYVTDAPLQEFARTLCKTDILRYMPLGSSFVKWLYITSATTHKSCLVFRLSHAQYDEMCLPMLLQHLSTLYSNGIDSQSDMVPFSTYMSLLLPTLPSSIPYWTNLLSSSSGITHLRPSAPLIDRKHFAIERTIPIVKAPTTIATLPTAAWSLVLARRLGIRDTVFGEVVSGRSIDASFAPEKVIGPCWQYVPFRVVFQDNWTIGDLLDYVQNQHAESAAHEGLSLEEISSHLPKWSPSHIASENEASTDDDKQDRMWWFDTVVHQAVQAVSELAFSSSSSNELGSQLETLYPHEEPLREWKIQAFISPDGKNMTLEVVTFGSWEATAKELLDEVCEAVTFLMQDTSTKLFPSV